MCRSFFHFFDDTFWSCTWLRYFRMCVLSPFFYIDFFRPINHNFKMSCSFNVFHDRRNLLCKKWWKKVCVHSCLCVCVCVCVCVLYYTGWPSSGHELHIAAGNKGKLICNLQTLLIISGSFVSCCLATIRHLSTLSYVQLAVKCVKQKR